MILFGLFGLMFTQYSYLTGIYHSNAATTVLQTLNMVLVMLFTIFLLTKSE